MNVDQGKTEFSLEERQELVAASRAFKDANGLTWTQTAARMDMTTGTLSAMNAAEMDLMHYADKQFAKIHRFFRSAEADEQIERIAPIVPVFQETKTAQRIFRALDWCRRGEIVAMPGVPGVGKTAALTQYQATRPNAWRVTFSPTSSNVFGMLLRVCQAMGNPRDYGAQLAMSRQIRAKLSGRDGVLMCDEANFLNDSALEELRSIHDETGVGVFLTGNANVLTRFGPTNAAFAQLHSRVSLRHLLEPCPEDAAVILSAWGVTDPAERAFLTEICMKKGGGAVRTLTQVLKSATLIARADDEPRVLGHLREAAVQRQLAA